VPERERVHILETAVILWSKQIEAVLKTDPQDVIDQGGFPTPLVELDFWKTKAADLRSLYGT
jgi:dynein heavy chain